MLSLYNAHSDFFLWDIVGLLRQCVVTSKDLYYKLNSEYLATVGMLYEKYNSKAGRVSILLVGLLFS